MLIFLVAAFARPYFPGNEKDQVFTGNLVSIYIDNSFSMNAQAEQGELLELAKERARELAKNYNATDKFQLLTNDFEGKHQRFESKDRFLQWVDEVELSAKTRKMSEVYDRQKEMLESEPGQLRRNVFQISDFQSSLADAEEMQADSNLNVFLLPLKPNGRDNISIDSAWLSTPYVRAGENLEMSVLLSNRGETEITELSLVLKINGEQKGLNSLTIEPGQQVETKIAFSIEQSGWFSGSLEIQDHPVVFDDKLFFVLPVQEDLKVLCVNGKDSSKFINGVFATDAYFNLKNAAARGLDYTQFSQVDLIILNELEEYSSGMISELKRFVENGGDLYLIPEIENGTKANGLLEALGIGSFANLKKEGKASEKVADDHPLYRDILENKTANTALPAVKQYFPLNLGSTKRTVKLIELAGGEPLLTLSAIGRGQVFVQTTGLDQESSDFGLNYLFPSTLLRIAIFSKEVPALYNVIGSMPYVPVNAQRENDKVLYEIKGQGIASVPEMLVRDKKLFLGLNELIKEAGIYQVTEKGSEKHIADLAFNYNRSESDMNLASPQELQEKAAPGMRLRVFDSNAKSVAAKVNEADNGTQLWKASLLLALLFLTIEILLLRFLR